MCGGLGKSKCQLQSVSSQHAPEVTLQCSPGTSKWHINVPWDGPVGGELDGWSSSCQQVCCSQWPTWWHLQTSRLVCIQCKYLTSCLLLCAKSAKMEPLHLWGCWLAIAALTASLLKQQRAWYLRLAVDPLSFKSWKWQTPPTSLQQLLIERLDSGLIDWTSQFGVAPGPTWSIWEIPIPWTPCGYPRTHFIY